MTDERDLDPSRWQGVPWLRGGRDPRVGLDCWGLVLLCLPGVPDYAGDAVERAALARATAAGWEDPRWRPLAEPRDLCLAMLDRTHAGVVWRGHVVHATECGVRIDPLRDLPGIGYRAARFLEWRPDGKAVSR